MAMEALHCPDNIKIHYAGAEVQNQYIAAAGLGVQYHLYTCYPFVERLVFGKGKSPIMPLRHQKDNPFYKIPQNIIQNSAHTIQDSGLFTLMFGSQAGIKDESLVNKWYDGLVEFTLQNAAGATCVEVDCQKILSPEKAWEFRERLAKDIPNRIINVFHLEDGQKGLDRLIEYSDYIAISVPELRKAGKKAHVAELARYIKSRKSSIDIHLLGCTELKLLQECNFCTSADSTTYVAGKRFGFINGKHINRIKTDEVRLLVGDELYNQVNDYNNEINTNFLCLNIMRLKMDYEQWAGNQDYKLT